MEQLVAFGQPWINVPRYHPIRPDLLVRYRSEQSSYWLSIEVDDRSSHFEKAYRDDERALKSVIPIVRIENQTVEQPWFFNNLLQKIRRAASEAARRRLNQLRRARTFDRARQADAARRLDTA